MLGGSNKRLRESWFGTDRPLDYPSFYKQRTLQRMGLDPSIRVNWYVEGSTELGYLQSALGSPRDCQVQILNRKGHFAGKTVERIFEEVQADLEAERFTFISIDDDVKENVESVRRLVDNNLVVGFISVSKPDFEFANFDLAELIEAAIIFDGTDPKDPIDSSSLLENADWSEVLNGGSFSDHYVRLHRQTRRCPKGYRWGATLERLGCD